MNLHILEFVLDIWIERTLKKRTDFSVLIGKRNENYKDFVFFCFVSFPEESGISLFRFALHTALGIQSFTLMLKKTIDKHIFVEVLYANFCLLLTSKSTEGRTSLFTFAWSPSNECTKIHIYKNL